METAMRRIDRGVEYMTQHYSGGGKWSWDNDAQMCSDSALKDFIRFEEYGSGGPLFLARPVNEWKQCDIRAMKAAFERGEVSKIFECWQPYGFKLDLTKIPGATTHLSAVGAPPGSFQLIQERNCAHEWRVYSNAPLQLCHPTTVYDGCRQDNPSRSCYIQQNSQFFTVAYFPWYMKGGASPSIGGTEMIGFSTGHVSGCRECQGDEDCSSYYINVLSDLSNYEVKVIAATVRTSEWVKVFVEAEVRDVVTQDQIHSKLTDIGKVILAGHSYPANSPPKKNVTSFEINKVSQATTADPSKTRACDKVLSLGCYSWYDSYSTHPCAESFISNCHSTNEWLIKFLMYNKWKTHVTAKGDYVQEDGTSAFVDDYLALFVPTLQGFSEEYSLTLETFSGKECGGDKQSITNAAATGSHPQPRSGGTPDSEKGVHYIPSKRQSFRLVPIHKTENRAHELYCTCPRNRTHLHGAETTNPPALHRCRLCRGNEYVAIESGTVKAVCGVTKYRCESCSVNGAHYIRRKLATDTDVGGCIDCPMGHVMNWARDPSTLAERRARHELTLEEMRDESSARYGVAWPEQSAAAVLREHQVLSPAQEKTFEHILGKRIAGGNYTCHICAFGYSLSPLRRVCLPLLFMQLRWTAATADAAGRWSLEVLPEGVQAQGVTPELVDQIAVDPLRTQLRAVAADRYLDLDAAANGTFLEVACPSDGHVGGRFRHLCGRRSRYVFVEVVQADLLQSTMVPRDYPAVGTRLIFDTEATTKEQRWSYIKYDTDPNVPVGYGSARDLYVYLQFSTSSMPGRDDQFMFGFAIVREGVEVSCKRCIDGRYNAGCTSAGVGLFGACVSCKVTSSPNTYLSHAMATGCDGWGDSGFFVDSDYTEEPCTGLRVSDGQGDGRRVELCVGFCGGRSTFEWWTPGPASITEEDNRPIAQTCTRAQTGPECQHPDTGEVFMVATPREECADLIPYCPVGFYVNVQCALDAEASKWTDAPQYRKFNPACCTRCQLNCEPPLRRRSDYEECPGDTVVDTQARCGEGCDVNHYFDAVAEQCKLCESCLEGLRV